jgi:hypothetical protein
LLAKPPDQPTEIRVQIMDSRTHRPLKGHKVQIMFSGMDGRTVVPQRAEDDRAYEL